MNTRITTRATRPTTTAVHAPLRRVRLSPGNVCGSAVTWMGDALSMVIPLFYVCGGNRSSLTTAQQAGNHDGPKSGQAYDPNYPGGRVGTSGRHAPAPHRSLPLLQRGRPIQFGSTQAPVLSPSRI